MLETRTDLGDQVVSPDLGRDVLLLSHLARSILSESCRAKKAITGGSPNTPEECLVAATRMERFGDVDTMRTLGRLYRRVAAAMGDETEANRRVEQLMPAGAAAFAIDLVGLISGRAPSIKLATTESGKRPAWIRHLKKKLPIQPGETRGLDTARAIFFGAAAIGLGLGAGYLLGRR